MKIKLFFLILTMMLSNICYSQVNIESKRIKNSKETKFISEIGIDLNYGEIKVLEYDFSFRVDKHFNKKNSILVLFNYKYGESDSVSFKNELFFHKRFTSMLFLNETLGYELFSQTQKNEFFDIKIRQLLGFIIRKKLFNVSLIESYLGLGYMKEWETLNNNNSSIDDRMTNYLTFILEEKNKYKIISTTYYQPMIKKVKDYRITSEFAILFSFNKKVGLKNSFNYQYDSNPPENIEKNNLGVSTDLILKY